MKHKDKSKMKVGDKIVFCPKTDALDKRYIQYFKKAFCVTATISEIVSTHGSPHFVFDDFDFSNFLIDDLIDWEETNKLYYENDVEELNYVRDEIANLQNRQEELLLKIIDSGRSK